MNKLILALVVTAALSWAPCEALSPAGDLSKCTADITSTLATNYAGCAAACKPAACCLSTCAGDATCATYDKCKVLASATAGGALAPAPADLGTTCSNVTSTNSPNYAKCAQACSPARCCNPADAKGMTGKCMSAGNCNSYSACAALLVAVSPQCTIKIPKDSVAPSSGVWLPKGDLTGTKAATFRKGSKAPEDGGTWCPFCLVVEAGQCTIMPGMFYSKVGDAGTLIAAGEIAAGKNCAPTKGMFCPLGGNTPPSSMSNCVAADKYDSSPSPGIFISPFEITVVEKKGDVAPHAGWFCKAPCALYMKGAKSPGYGTFYASPTSAPITVTRIGIAAPSNGMFCPAYDTGLVWNNFPGTGMCGGLHPTCGAVAGEDPTITAYKCTATGLGPCQVGATKPEWYVTTSFVAAAFVDAAKYLTCDNPLKCDHMKILPGTSRGYKDFAANKVVGPSKIAYTMTGQVFGSMATAGAYLGMASVLNTGDTDIVTDRSSFLLATEDGQPAVMRDGSPDGAPMGPYNVCISEDKECKTKRTFKAKGYKFSIFGYTSGTNYPAAVKAGANGFPAAQTHLGVRVALVGGGGVDLSKMVINGDKTIDTIGGGNVKSISLPAPDGTTQAWTFPTKYGTGDVSTLAAPDNTKLPAVKSVKNVQIRIGAQKSPEGGIDYYHLDYLFELADFQTAKQYFVYDPDVAATGTPTGKWVQEGKTLAKVDAGTTPGSAAAKAKEAAKKAKEAAKKKKESPKFSTGPTTVPSLAVAVVAMFALWR